ncbi:putative zinc-finger containing protein [Namao virus]|nr:putative zinc-finger containing protein [Namao virus]
MAKLLKRIRKRSTRHNCGHGEVKYKIYAECCRKSYSCMACHDDHECHNVTPGDIMMISCHKCLKLQAFSSSCTSCHKKFGSYSCSLCKLNTDKDVSHCILCDRCHFSGDRYFYCNGCSTCLPDSFKNKHLCDSEINQKECPICLECILTPTNQPLQMLKCKHALHIKCFNAQYAKDVTKYKCVVCSCSVYDMKKVWADLDHRTIRSVVIESGISIICNDCHTDTYDTVSYVFGSKCQGCGSYNTYPK